MERQLEWDVNKKTIDGLAIVGHSIDAISAIRDRMWRQPMFVERGTSFEPESGRLIALENDLDIIFNDHSQLHDEPYLDEISHLQGLTGVRVSRMFLR